jgi:4-amino-4-deoxy-L-arabinose transferase-like glycosyltransferase
MPSRIHKLKPYIFMVLAALVIRLAVMGFLYPEQLDPDRDHWRFGYETGRIARSIVLGRGFSSPLFAYTGPTAWMTPVYPYIVAGVFKLFGIYTTASAFVLLSLNALISALNCLPIVFFARRCFGEHIGRWAGWTWAFFPYAIYFPVERIWETWLATLLLSVLFLMTLRLEKAPSLREWIGFGALWGVAALTSPAMLAVLPCMGGWICYRLCRRRERWLVPATVSAIVLFAVISPWFIRNYYVFDQVVPFRDNMGLVLRLGTKGDATNTHWAVYELGPWHNDAEWKEFLRWGELGYMERKKQQAVQAIAADPRWYVWTSFRRAVFLWTGYWSFDRAYLAEEPLDPYNIVFCTAFTVLAMLGLWRAFQQDAGVATLYALVLFFFPVIYYITSPEVYYRRPIDPMMVVLAVYAVGGWKRASPRDVSSREATALN